MISAIDRIKPLLEVEVVETMMVQTDQGGLGGGTPPIVVAVEGV